MLKFNSLKMKMTTLFTGMLALFCVILLLAVQLVAQTFIKNYINNNIYMLQNQMDIGIKMVLDDVNYLYNRLIADNKIERLLNDGTLTDEQKREQYRDIIQSSGMNAELYGDIVVYDGEQYFRISDFESSDLPSLNFLEDILNSEKPLEMKQGNIISYEENDYILIGIGMQSYGITYAASVFYIKEQAFRSVFTSIDSGGYSFAVAGNQTILSHPDRKNIGAVIFGTDYYNFDKLPNYKIIDIDNTNSIIVANSLSRVKKLYGFEWNIVSIFNYDLLLQDIFALQIIIVIIGIIISVIAGIVAVRIALALTRPINDLNRAIKEFTLSGQKPNRKRKSSGDEIAQLDHAYEEMIDRLIELMEANIRDMEKQRKLELDALQLQINPHFLYNTLDTIAWMAKLKKQPEIERLVMALSKFFRISLHKGDKFISVREEFELIKNFINIELVRFPEKFTIEYELSEEVAECETLKLILQPIVENAIKHGISQIDYMGNIIIKAYAKEEDIIFEVIDNGRGFDSAEDIMKKLRASNSPGGYGLKNVDERIKLEYGSDYGILIHSHINEGACVTVRIKKRKI